ncbi:MAG: helix-turn-helix transcriptional regulator [Gammaproteobacteria bacterium]|nr:helix-turn-helix transcriptional regulator [Gammaproteobacteria bacterium]
MATQFLPQMGKKLARARKKRFPGDDMRAFSKRVCVARSTYQRMEKGDLSVAFASYYKAALILELTEGFEQLFTLQQAEEGWLNDV